MTDIVASPGEHILTKGLREQGLVKLSPDQLEQFGNEIASVGKKAIDELGDEKDERFLRKLKNGNLSCEVIGRALIHISFEPVTFLLGVIFLSIHFNLEVTLAHNAGHGAFNRLKNRKGLDKYSSKSYQAKNMPASMEGWKYVHNQLHHMHCNIVGKDPDVGYDLFRVTELQGKPKGYQRFQVAIIALMSLPLVLITGLRTYEFQAAKDNEEKGMLSLLYRQLTGNRYFLVNLVFFPLLAGLAFFSFAHVLKVLLGNMLAEALRGLSYGSMFHMGHHTGTVKFYPENTEVANRSEWFVQQIESSHSVMMDSRVRYVFGGLDLQIEHHLFPSLPPNKLYEIQPQIEAICDKYGVHYSNAGFFESAALCVKNYANHADQARCSGSKDGKHGQ